MRLIVLSLLFMLTALKAWKKGFNPWLWLLASGPLGLVVVWLLPSSKNDGMLLSRVRKGRANVIGFLLSCLAVGVTLGLVAMVKAERPNAFHILQYIMIVSEVALSVSIWIYFSGLRDWRTALVRTSFAAAVGLSLAFSTGLLVFPDSVRAIPAVTVNALYHALRLIALASMLMLLVQERSLNLGTIAGLLMAAACFSALIGASAWKGMGTSQGLLSVVSFFLNVLLFINLWLLFPGEPSRPRTAFRWCWSLALGLPLLHMFLLFVFQRHFGIVDVLLKANAVLFSWIVPMLYLAAKSLLLLAVDAHAIGRSFRGLDRKGGGDSARRPNQSHRSRWQCPACGTRLEKGLGMLFESVLGSGTCTRCGASFPQCDIYSGKYDLPTEEVGDAWDEELLDACRLNQIAAARAILESGVSASGTGGPAFPLRIAAGNGNRTLVALLLQHGADPNTTGIFGNTAIMAAAESHHFDIVEQLLDAGADPLVQDHAGASVLTHAAAGSLPLVSRLVDLGCDVNCHDQRGNSPLKTARRSGRQLNVKRLIEAGAYADSN